MHMDFSVTEAASCPSQVLTWEGRHTWSDVVYFLSHIGKQHLSSAITGALTNLVK